MDFHEWLELNHPEVLEEGFPKWARNAAAAAALGMGVMGGVGCSGPECKIPDQSVTAPNAGEYLDVDDEIPSVQKTEKSSDFQRAFGRHKQQRQRLRDKANQLKKAGRSSGTFVHGELQN